jgi:hypothetical protein
MEQNISQKITKEKNIFLKETRIYLKLANFKFMKTFGLDSNTTRKVMCTFVCSKLNSIFEIKKIVAHKLQS